MITVPKTVSVSLSPSNVALLPSGAQQLTAAVLGTSNTAVTWSINPSVGTISSAGLYMAPASIVTPQTVTVTAQSVADPTKSATGVLSLQTSSLGGQWSIGYYSAKLGNPTLPVAAIQWTGLTHVIHYSTVVNADGTLVVQEANQAAELVTAAHAHNVRVLVGLGQWYATSFDQAITNHLPTLVANIMTVLNTYGYDGVDIDWEPLPGGFIKAGNSGADMTALAHALRAALGSRVLTTAALGGDQAYWGTAHASFDRINVMTYDMCGTWFGYLWYNSSLYGVGHGSLDDTKAQYLAAGVPAAKLDLGLAFYGWKWTGGILASNPTQGISGPTQFWQTGNAPTGAQFQYNDILPLITQQNYSWDPSAMVPYVNYIGTTPSTYWYLTYDNPQSIQAKVQYIIAQNLGGWIIWHLSADYLPGDPHPHPLLDAVSGALPAR